MKFGVWGGPHKAWLQTGQRVPLATRDALGKGLQHQQKGCGEVFKERGSKMSYPKRQVPH